MKKAFLHVLRALFYSRDGISSAWKQEYAFKLEILLGILVVPATFIIGHSFLDYALLLSTYLLILLTELLNTAIEAVVDRISEEKGYTQKDFDNWLNDPAQ